MGRVAKPVPRALLTPPTPPQSLPIRSAPCALPPLPPFALSRGCRVCTLIDFLGADAEASTEEAGDEAGEAGGAGEAGQAGRAGDSGEGGEDDEGGEVLLEGPHEASLMLFAITALTA